MAAVPLSPTPTPPTLNQRLAIIYAKAEQKVRAADKRRKSASKDIELLARFKGDFPPSLLKVMAGDPTTEVGFHKIALQIAITANALGKKTDDVLAMCEGLFNSHQSDSGRYNTPAKRRAELKRMLGYTADNPCYVYSKGGIRSLIPAEVATPDLDGITESPEGAQTGSMAGGVMLLESGLWQKTAGGAEQVCDMSFKDVVMLKDAKTLVDSGFEAEVSVNGKSKGHKSIELNYFLGRAHFQKLAVMNVGEFNGTDAHVTALLGILRDTAEMNDAVIYKIGREGMDLIQRPDTVEDIQDFVWASPVGVVADSHGHLHRRPGRC